jgi:transcriptional regulator with XRE-family HTH domain
MCLPSANDWQPTGCYSRRMAHSRPKRFTNWYLRDWMATLNVTQAQLVEATDLSKTAVSLLADDRQDYRPDIIRDIAAALNIAPYELLMQPAVAMALRRQRESAAEVVTATAEIEAEKADEAVIPIKRAS